MNGFFEAPVQGAAQFSPDKQLRHVLSRSWSEGSYRPLVCMANPSTAGAVGNDPTVQTLIRYFKSVPQCDGFNVVNWSPKIASRPIDHEEWLKAVPRPEWNRIMGANLYLLKSMAQLAPYVVVAWGNLVSEEDHAYTGMVVQALTVGSKRLWCFGTNANGSPKHPMSRGRNRIDFSQPLVRWTMN